MIDRIMTFYSLPDLIARLGGDFPPDADIKQRLRDLQRRQLLELFIPTLSDDEIKALDEVRANRLTRPHRADWEAAAQDLPTELERERAIARLAKKESEAAPSIQEVEKLYRAPTLEPITSGDGPAVKVKKWVVGPDGRPVEVDFDELP